MFDAVGMSLRAVAEHSAYGFPMVFVAGALTSIGPCVAPRFIAVAALTTGQTPGKALGTTASFVGGLAAAYATFGLAASLLGRVTEASSAIYALVAAAMFLGGVATLAAGKPRHCSHSESAPLQRSFGGPFLLGASFACVVSPCCTPLVVGILAYTTAVGNAVYGSALLVTFALGHALPVVAVGGAAGNLGRFFARLQVREATSIVSGALMLAMGLYYAVLA